MLDLEWDTLLPEEMQKVWRELAQEVLQSEY